MESQYWRLLVAQEVSVWNLTFAVNPSHALLRTIYNRERITVCVPTLQGCCKVTHEALESPVEMLSSFNWTYSLVINCVRVTAIIRCFGSARDQSLKEKWFWKATVGVRIPYL